MVGSRPAELPAKFKRNLPGCRRREGCGSLKDREMFWSLVPQSVPKKLQDLVGGHDDFVLRWPIYINICQYTNQHYLGVDDVSQHPPGESTALHCCTSHLFARLWRPWVPHRPLGAMVFDSVPRCSSHFWFVVSCDSFNMFQPYMWEEDAKWLMFSNQIF